MSVYWVKTIAEVVAVGEGPLDLLLEAAGLGVGAEPGDLLEQLQDAGPLLGDQAAAGDLGGLLDVEDLLDLLILGQILVQQGELLVGQPLGERLPQGVEGAGQASAVDGHDEPDGRPLILGGVVVGRADVVLDGVVQGPLGRGHRDGDVLDIPGGDRRRQQALRW